MQNLIETEIKRMKPVMAELQFEGVPLNKIIDVLSKHLISKINKLENQMVKEFQSVLDEEQIIEKPQARTGSPGI